MVHVEGDVHFPSVANIVVIHDGNVYRTTDGSDSRLNRTYTQFETPYACDIVLGWLHM